VGKFYRADKESLWFQAVNTKNLLLLPTTTTTPPGESIPGQSR